MLLEITQFQVDNKLPQFQVGDDFMKWWTEVFKMERYPALTRVISVVMSMFHGPQVESSFNLMGNVENIRSTRMNIETLSAYQTVKYAFKARKTTALAYFKRSDVRKDPVKKCICISLRKAGSKYKQEQERKKEMKEKRKQ